MPLSGTDTDNVVREEELLVRRACEAQVIEDGGPAQTSLTCHPLAVRRTSSKEVGPGKLLHFNTKREPNQGMYIFGITSWSVVKV